MFHRFKLIVCLILVLLPFSLYAKDKKLDYSNFLGTWTNVDKNTQSIVKFEITADAKGNPLISLKGNCSLTFCDIGPYKLVLYGDSVASKKAVSAIANYDIDWSKGYYVLRLESADKVELSSYNSYDDFRTNSYTSGVFVKSDSVDK